MSFRWQRRGEESLLVHESPALRLRSARVELSWARAGAGTERLVLEQLPAGPDGAGTLAPGWSGSCPEGLRVELVLRLEAEGAELHGSLCNEGSAPLRLEQLSFLLDEVRLGQGEGRHAFFAGGHQSWTASRTYAPGERQLVPLLPFAQLMQDNLAVRPPSAGRELVAAELYGLLGRPDDGVCLLLGQQGGFAQWFYVRLTWDRRGQPGRLELVHDFGGQLLSPGKQQGIDPVALLAGTEPCALLERFLDRLQVPGMDQRRPPSGWCSWYCLGPRVSRSDLDENLSIAAKQAPGRHIFGVSRPAAGILGKVPETFFQLDDGWQTEVGDWLSVNEKFPGGLAGFCAEVREQGMLPGLWLAPFLARRSSRLFSEHPDWFLQDRRGRPLFAGYNPLWGLDGRCAALDTTHPGFQEHLARVVRTMVHEWGFRLLKLDFLYAASLRGKARDLQLSPAQRLALGYDLIREAAGPEVLLLGCGAPLGPSIGRVDAMRIGPDVAPFWFPTLRWHLTRDPHALSALFSIRSTLTRSPLHRRLWLNDPDCLMLREHATRLTEAERQTLATAIVISGGVLLVSDRLSELTPAAWQRLGQVQELVQRCAGGHTRPLDLLEGPIPELVYNSAGCLAVFRFADHPGRKRIEYRRWLAGLVPEQAELRSVWDGRTFRVEEGWLDLGTMPAHGSLLLVWEVRE